VLELMGPVVLPLDLRRDRQPRQCPAIPYTPEEYAAEARRIVDEGGSMIHIHARTREGVPSFEVEDFAAIQAAILDEVG
jgi:uncharacterized protein (DUF849 family)